MEPVTNTNAGTSSFWSSLLSSTSFWAPTSTPRQTLSERTPPKISFPSLIISQCETSGTVVFCLGHFHTWVSKRKMSSWSQQEQLWAECERYFGRRQYRPIHKGHPWAHQVTDAKWYDWGPPPSTSSSSSPASSSERLSPGIPDLGIPPLDPFEVPHFDIPHIEWDSLPW